MREKLREILQELHLQGMSDALDKALDQAEKNATSAAELLYQLALEERRVRQEKSLANRLKQARMPWDWTLESFPFTQQPGVNKTQIKTLAGLDFVSRAENLVFIGPPGTGKSGLACSLLRQACCGKPASTATVAASTMPRPCWMNSTPHWPIAARPGCSSA